MASWTFDFEATTAILLAAVFAAALIQSLSGFGFALMIMPVATWVVGLQTAAPVVALVAVTTYAINVYRFRGSINATEALRLAAASAFGIPLGIWALSHVDEFIINGILGLVLVLYALQSLVRAGALRPCSPNWVYPAGFLAGCLGGAYNTPGPPVVLYGSLRQWPKDVYRATLQTLFLANGLLVSASHGFAGNLTARVLFLVLCAFPAMLLGIWGGHAAVVAWIPVPGILSKIAGFGVPLAAGAAAYLAAAWAMGSEELRELFRKLPRG